MASSGPPFSRPASIPRAFATTSARLSSSKAARRCVGEFRQIENLAWDALDAAPGARNLCMGILCHQLVSLASAVGSEHYRRDKR